MNPQYFNFSFPNIAPCGWSTIFRKGVNPECTELLAAFLQYDPEARIWPLDACAHHYFDSLRDQHARCSDGQPLPPDLFNLTQQEQSICSLELRKRLVPAWHVTASAAWSP